MGEEYVADHSRRAKIMRTIPKTETIFRLFYSKKQLLFLAFAVLSSLYVLIYGVHRISVKEILEPHAQFSYGTQWIDDLPPEKCICGNFAVCYGYNRNENPTRNLSGAAFRCRNQTFFDKAAPIRKVSFAVTADSELLSQLLVLIGSIHKYYKEHAILVYDIGNPAEQKKQLRGILANIRNVEVIAANDVLSTAKRARLGNGAHQPLLMIDSLNKYQEVYWMSPLHEIISDLIMEYPSDFKFSTYLRIGHRTVQDHKKLDFARYFPFSTLTPQNCSFRYIHNSKETRNILFWLAQCAQTADCWRCQNADDEDVDCMPFLETRLSEDCDMPLMSDHRYTALNQKWSAPECGWRCALSSLAAIFTFVLLTASLLFVISARFVAD